MSIIKTTVIKCVTALLISAIMASGLIAYADSDTRTAVKIVDGEKVTELGTHCTTAEEILSEAEIELDFGDEAELTLLEDGSALLTVKRAFSVFVSCGDKTVMVKMVGGTVADAVSKAGFTLGANSVCSPAPETSLTKETYVDLALLTYVTESYEEKIPFTAKVEYSSSLKKGEKKVTEGKEGTRTVTVKKTYSDGKVVNTEVISSEVTTPARDKVTVIGTKGTSSAGSASASGTKPYSSINPISGLKPPASLTLTSKGVPTSYKKKVTVEATAYTDHSGTPCASGVLPATGYIAVNPKVIPYGTKMFIVSADGKYVYGYAIAADTGGFIKKRPNNVDLFFNTKSECRKFGRRDVVIYFL